MILPVVDNFRKRFFYSSSAYHIKLLQSSATSAMTYTLPCPEQELQLRFTLNGGQSFRWKETKENEWTGVFSNRVWKLRRNNDSLEYDVYKCTKPKVSKGKKQKSDNSSSKPFTKAEVTENEKLLIDYFRLDTSLKELYDNWSNADPVFKEAAEKFYGIRILKQDPVENIFSFICSTNNHISRISSMVEKLCTSYGEKICDLDGVSYFSFPPVEALAVEGVEENLRKLGFGYRAKYIHQSAMKIIEFGGNSWLDNLTKMSYKDAKVELMKLTGIGAKVADCISLMSLGHLESVPVDTHVFQIASQLYLPHLKSAKTVTTKIYDEIGDHFRLLYGNEAGWAHTILFCADLKMFQDKGMKREKITDKKSKRRKT
ncbi:hypothetical protein LSTR_LSTR002369 [Laodelphax striatellus]|uniref:N-glycosylase/DNA lyase n=1 Tax=Laodelphax striatellus TaxID=195883 RepID=A0A482X2Y1_LAOST|nr:hypothetical protein LSTR_LSTR002369 [Laodelphax striatellus]